MDIQPLSPSLGSIINDLNLRQPLTNSLLTELRAIWLDRQVIILRNQALTAEQYLAFVKQLGTPDIYPFLNL